MTTVKIEGHASGSGSATVKAPNTNSDITLTLPDADVTIPNAIPSGLPSTDAGYSKNVLTTTGDVLYASGANTLARRAIGSTGDVLTVAGGVPTWAAAAGGGKVLQYVWEEDDTSVTTSGSTEATLIDLNITPASASNKILCIASVVGLTWPSSNAWMQGRIRRGDETGTILVQYMDGHGNEVRGWSRTPMVLDSPNTTSSQEYTLTLLRGSGNTSNAQTDGNKYSLLLVELEG